MTPPITALRMPDIAQQALPAPDSTLDWVGMQNIHQPILLHQVGRDHRVVASVDSFVDLNDPHAKGIHMSRLYLLLDEHARTRRLTPAGVKMLLNSMFQSHLDISGCAHIRFSFDYCIERPALKSDNSGWSNYPVTIEGTFEDGAITLDVGIEVRYSSTCPCSAALARQLIQTAFDDAFAGCRELSPEAVRDWLGSEQGIVATPHSQRSVGQIKVRLDDAVDQFPIDALIDAVEHALMTPVQTAVKREDEQEFALRNGQNLMFCEDAARKIKRALDADATLADYWIRVEHQESLHPHDAVAVATKGVAGGFKRLTRP